MSLVCPKCAKALKALDIRKRFACPGCGVELRGHITVPLVLGIVLWSIIEFIVKQFIDGSLGILGSLLGVAIGACIGIPLTIWLMNIMGTVDTIEKAVP